MSNVDPFAVTQEQIDRAWDAISLARTFLMLDHKWFGSLALNLTADSTVRPDIDTMATDGTHLYAYPPFVLSLSQDELIGVLAHEIMHCAMLHPYRRGNRDPERWNIAADYAINDLLITQGFKLPPGALHDPKTYPDMDAETIYARLPQSAQMPGGQSVFLDPSGPQAGQGGQPDPNGQPTAGQGGQPDPNGQTGPDAGPSNTETKWRVAVELANTIARIGGYGDGSQDRALDASRRAREDWRQILQEWITTNVTPSDYSLWPQFNRSIYFQTGILFPGIVKEGIGGLAYFIDTSESITKNLIQTFGAHLASILADCHPEYIDVIYCDSHIRGGIRIESIGDMPSVKPIGGGGTCFNPPFAHYADPFTCPCSLDHYDVRIPMCALYLTDLENCDDPVIEPNYPVLWVVPQSARIKAGPFGRTIVIDD